MPTTIIACSGEGEIWVQDPDTNEGSPTCPGCGLPGGTGEGTLGIKIRKLKNGKLNPPKIPAHEVEVEGAELRAFVNPETDHYDVHTPTCPTLKTNTKKFNIAKQEVFTIVAENRMDAIRQLWYEVIETNENTPEDADPMEVTEQFLNDEGYVGGTEFHRCVNRPFPTGGAKKSADGGANSRDAKKFLADYVIKAIAEALLNGTLPAEVLAGMDADTAIRTAVQWVHHLPVHRELWPAQLPKPQRSDWKQEEEKPAATVSKDADEEEQDTTDEDSDELEEDSDDFDTEDEDELDSDELDEDTEEE